MGEATETAVDVILVATDRGSRSVWWSRRAEVAEALCGSSTLAAVLVSSGSSVSCGKDVVMFGGSWPG